MPKKIVISLLLLLFGETVYGDVLYSILNSSRHIEAIEDNIQSIAMKSLRSEQDIDLMVT
jgi:hypothetical protein